MLLNILIRCVVGLNIVLTLCEYMCFYMLSLGDNVLVYEYLCMLIVLVYTLSAFVCLDMHVDML